MTKTKKKNRKDSKGKVLRTGESERSNGTYMYRYVPKIRGRSVNSPEKKDNRITIYAKTLPELRQKELQITQDIIEEIVGNIWDEYDEVDEFIVGKRDNSYILHGSMPLEELGELIGEDFDMEEYDTLNGFLISLLDRIPSDEEKPIVAWKDYIFTIHKIENRMITEVELEKCTLRN